MSSTLYPKSRLGYVDATRALAIIGMMITHVSVLVPIFQLLSFPVIGRSALAFALLAGVSVIFISRSAGDSICGATAIATRAVLLIALGLTLPLISNGPIVILTTYGVLFIAAIPLLKIKDTRILAVLTAIAVIVLPIASFVIRREKVFEVNELGAIPQLQDFTSVQGAKGALSSLFLTGMYPVITWLPLLMAGLVIGRFITTDRFRARTAGLAGAALCVLGYGVSWFVYNKTDFLELQVEQMRATSPDFAELSHEEVLAMVKMVNSFAYGVTSTSDWRSLFVSTAHSGSIAELVGGIGIVLLVLAAFKALERSLPKALAPLSLLGRISLTYYVGHIAGLTLIEKLGYEELSVAASLVVFIVAPVVFAAVWLRFFKRGPLEEVMHQATALILKKS